MDILLVVTFFVALLSSILSGMSGGGGGFVMTPYYLGIGLTPQQIVGVGSVASLGLGTSSLLAMRGRQLIRKQYMWPLALFTVAMTILAMLFLPKIKSDTFQLTVAIILICAAPMLFIKKSGLQPGARSRAQIYLGYATYTVMLFAAALASGIATLLVLPLMFLMGLTALEANALRRVLGLLQAAVIFFAVLPQGFIVWSHALVSLAGCWIGAHIGTKIALKKGDKLVKIGLASVMVLSGLALVIWR